MKLCWRGVTLLTAVLIALASVSRPALSDTVADQTAYYGVQPRTYERLQEHADASFPDFKFFIGLEKTRPADYPPPDYIPICSSAGISAPGALLKEVSGARPPDEAEVRIDVLIALRDLGDILYRMRACDYILSVYAWNTRLRAHDEAFDYSWKTACNSFQSEQSASTLSAAALDLLAAVNPTGPHTKSTPTSRSLFLQFLLQHYNQYRDLYERLDSCASIAGGLAYDPNTRRFFCNYGGFIGALLTASSTAFGKHWGGTNSSTQSQVTGLGTVMIALPGLCQNGGAGSAKKGGKG
jgi:hypothetical protein